MAPLFQLLAELRAATEGAQAAHDPPNQYDVTDYLAQVRANPNPNPFPNPLPKPNTSPNPNPNPNPNQDAIYTCFHYEGPLFSEKQGVPRPKRECSGPYSVFELGVKHAAGL